MQNPPASAEVWLERLVNDASLEVTVRDKNAARILRNRLPVGARVHVTYLSNAPYSDTIAQSKSLAVAGFDPIPHLAARSLRSETELSDYLARLAGEAGATRVLLVAGDLETPRGPFASSLDVLKTGRLERNGISGIGFAAHPEGHPVVADAVMAQALADKVAYATERGLEAEVVTQFCFEAAPIVRCLRSLRASGVDVPVRIGAAAPADALRMMKFALRCGIGPSLRALERHGARLGGVMGAAGPESLVEELGQALAAEDFGAVGGMHFFVFGGVERSADWLVNWRGALKGDLMANDKAKPLSNIAIAQQARMRPIAEIAAKLGIPEDKLEPYGRFKAKIALEHLRSLEDRPDGKLVLMTAISPTPAGEGKTTTTVGLGDALNRIGEKAIICLREPAMGPVFGVKGGAAGGGYSQVVPMEDINLHFTGDFAAIAQAHNLLAALIDNHIHHGNELGFDVRRISWRRVVDCNDRALRQTNVALGGPGNGYPREDGFDIVVASEVMAIFCLATSLSDLKARLGAIIVGQNSKREPIRARDLNAHGAMAVLLKDAISPNLVQTLENNPAFIHGGPFANIAHGCNTVSATKAALKLADYVVTEAGFGADLGAEKFIDIKCRKAGLAPSAAVIVATARALKFHGGVEVEDLAKENVEALVKGMANLERHIDNIGARFGLPLVVAVNQRAEDSEGELAALQERVRACGARAVLAQHFAEGGKGAEALAREVVELCAGPSNFKHLYADETPLWEKMKTVATQIYGASDIVADSAVRKRIKDLQEGGYGHFPVCVAKTQYSFSTDPKLRGAPSGHVVNIREVRLAAGAEFVVMICGDIMTMPGLPKTPSAVNIDIDEHGKVVGLF